MAEGKDGAEEVSDGASVEAEEEEEEEENESHEPADVIARLGAAAEVAADSKGCSAGGSKGDVDLEDSESESERDSACGEAGEAPCESTPAEAIAGLSSRCVARLDAAGEPTGDA